MATSDAAPPHGISVPDLSPRAPAAKSPPGRQRKLRLGGRDYPVILPSLRDARLHVALVLLTLQLLGQTVLGFRLSVAQILISLAVGALIEFVVAFFKDKIILWPASGLLTGNSTAFILRTPGTLHGDWWSLHGIWIFVGVVAVSMLSKYLIRWKGRHIFNPSNLGLVIAFVALGPQYTEPMDLFWIPMGFWMIVTYAILIAGGLFIGWELKLLGLEIGFMVAFAAGLAIALAPVPDHCMVASWHVTPMCGRELWQVIVTSPELLIFALFMVPDPRTVPDGQAARLVFGVLVGVLAVILLGPTALEFWTKTAILASLVIACALRFGVARLLEPLDEAGGRLAAIRRLGWAAPAVLGATLLVVSALPVAADISTHGPQPAAGLIDGSRPNFTYKIGGGPALGSWISDTAGAALPPPTSAGPASATARVWILPPLPAVTYASNVTTFDPSITPQSAAQLAHDAVLDLVIESEARRAHDLQLAATGADGDGLTEFTDVIKEDIPTGKIVQKTYKLDQIKLELFLPKFATQAPRLIGITLHGTATFTTRDASGKVLSQSTSAYDKSWGLSGATGPDGHRTIVVDYTGLAPAP